MRRRRACRQAELDGFENVPFESYKRIGSQDANAHVSVHESDFCALSRQIMCCGDLYSFAPKWRGETKMAKYTLPKESLMVKMAPFVMLMGIMISLTGLILSFVASGYVSDALAGDSGDAESLQELGAYVMPLTLTGVAFILMAITIFLRGIFKGIRAMGLNVTDALNAGR